LQAHAKSIRSAIVLSFGLILLPSNAQQPVESIHVRITGLRNDKGQVQCALFSSAADFPKKGDKAVDRTKSEILSGQASCDFVNVAPGRYAVSVFHDENSNGKLDTNFVGIPREGIGASNNPSRGWGHQSLTQPHFSTREDDWSSRSRCTTYRSARCKRNQRNDRSAYWLASVA